MGKVGQESADAATGQVSSVEHSILPFQEILLKDYKHQELGYPGGYGSGKTWFAAFWHFDRALKNIGCESWWISPNYPLTYEGFKVCVEVLERCGWIEGTHFTALRAPGKMQIYLRPADHEINFKSANQNLQAATISHLTVDEAGDCEEDGVKKAVARIRDQKAMVRQRLFVGAPQGLNHYYRRFYEKESKVVGSHEQFRVNEKQLCLHFRTYWNTFLPEEYIDTLVDEYGHDKFFVDAWILGKFVPLSQNNCFKFDERIHMTGPELDPAIPTVYIGWDFNVGQVAFVGLQPRDDQWCAVFEGPQHLRDTDEACAALINLLDPATYRYHEIIIDGDASGHSGSTKGKDTDYGVIRDRLTGVYENFRIIAPHHNTGVAHRVMSTNRLFAKNRLLLHSSLKYTKEGLNLTTWDNHGNIKKGSKDTWSHRPDALSYVVSRQEPISKKGFVGGARW